MEKEQFKYLISEECERIKELLISTNYDEVLDEYQIGLIRIENKVNRLKSLICLKEECNIKEEVNNINDGIIDAALDIASSSILYSIYLKRNINNEK